MSVQFISFEPRRFCGLLGAADSSATFFGAAGFLGGSPLLFGAAVVLCTTRFLSPATFFRATGFLGRSPLLFGAAVVFGCAALIFGPAVVIRAPCFVGPAAFFRATFVGRFSADAHRRSRCWRAACFGRSVAGGFLPRDVRPAYGALPPRVELSSARTRSSACRVLVGAGLLMACRPGLFVPLRNRVLHEPHSGRRRRQYGSVAARTLRPRRAVYPGRAVE